MRRAAMVVGAGVLVSALLLVVGCGGSGDQGSASVGKTWEDVIAAAKEEGSVMFATSGDEEIFAKAFKPFEQKYGIDVEIFRQAGEQITERMLSEQAARRSSIDLIHAPTETILALKASDLIADVDVPVKTEYPSELRFDDWGITMRLLKFAITYNTDLVDASEAEALKADGIPALLRGNWTGRVGIEFPERGNGSGFNLLYTYNDTGRLTDEDLNALARLKPAYDRSATPLTERLVAGDFAVYPNAELPQVSELKKSGAPIDWVQRDEMFALPVPGAVSKEAPHPNAARLALNYILSQPAQKLLVKNGESTAHPEVEDPYIPSGYDPRLVVASTFTLEKANAFTKKLIRIFNR